MGPLQECAGTIVDFSVKGRPFARAAALVLRRLRVMRPISSRLKVWLIKHALILRSGATASIRRFQRALETPSTFETA
jgi:hypothetical protein